MTKTEALELHLGDRVRVKGTSKVVKVAGHPYTRMVKPGSRATAVVIFCMDGVVPVSFEHHQVTVAGRG